MSFFQSLLSILQSLLSMSKVNNRSISSKTSKRKIESLNEPKKILFLLV